MDQAGGSGRAGGERALRGSTLNGRQQETWALGSEARDRFRGAAVDCAGFPPLTEACAL